MLFATFRQVIVCSNSFLALFVCDYLRSSALGRLWSSLTLMYTTGWLDAAHEGSRGWENQDCGVVADAWSGQQQDERSGTG